MEFPAHAVDHRQMSDGVGIDQLKDLAGSLQPGTVGPLDARLGFGPPG
jgi:hypothetical protein